MSNTQLIHTYGTGIPGVYIEDAAAPPIPLNTGLTDFVCGFVGQTPRGRVDKEMAVGSWAEYVRTYSFGLSTPFNPNMDLSYSVYGFFANGGRLLHVKRVVAATATTAKTTGNFAQVTGGGLLAADPGAWGNQITVVGTADTTDPDQTVYNVSIQVNGIEQEFYRGLLLTPGANFFLDILSGSQIIALDPLIDETATFVASDITGTFTFAGGDDKQADITDADYVAGLDAFDTIVDINLVCIPGQSTTVVRRGLMVYAAEKRKDVFAIIDPPQNSTVASLRTLRKEFNTMQCAMYYPYGLMADPLSPTGALREVPPSGHVAGVYCRTVQDDSIRAPAGVNARVVTFADLSYHLSDAEAGEMHDIGINAIVDKPGGVGIVVWGDRSLADPNDKHRRYVTDGLVYTIVRKNIYIVSLPFIFHRNTETTWNLILSAVKAFMSELHQLDILQGRLPSEAYYVQPNPTENTQASIDNGVWWIDVAYAASKPLEFIVATLAIQVLPNSMDANSVYSPTASGY